MLRLRLNLRQTAREAQEILHLIAQKPDVLFRNMKSSRLKGLPAHVNLIPLNEVAESPLHPSSRQAVQQFQRILEEGGLTATVRRTLGGDIDASCGQLRRKFEGETNLPRR